jgi:hypothetical protein
MLQVRGSLAVDAYDPAQYDSWSLGLVLLMMLGVDKLEIVTHQLMRGNQQVKEKVVRMPFVGYRTTNGDRCARARPSPLCGRVCNVEQHAAAPRDRYGC